MCLLLETAPLKLPTLMELPFKVESFEAGMELNLGNLKGCRNCEWFLGFMIFPAILRTSAVDA